MIPLAGCGSDPPSPGTPGGARSGAAATGAPGPDEPLPQRADDLARRLGDTHDALGRSIDRWLADGGRRERAPRDVKLYALHQQRIYVLLTSRKGLAGDVVDRLRGQVADEARDTLAARRELTSLSTPVAARHLRTGPAEPAGVLLRYYRKAERRFGVSWRVLAAVNFVESAFGRTRSNSSAGARGPMQFIPSTWRAYGMGGDIDDPHDAIMGAANYLHASGAPEDNRAALHAYNPSAAYVNAVLSYAHRMRHDRHAFYGYYSWQVFVNTPSGLVQLTGPGADR